MADGSHEELPADVVDEAERLTRLARQAVDDAERAAYRAERGGLLAEHDYTARVRTEADGDVLVCHPAEWVEDGTVRTDRIEDTDRAVERPLSGPGDAADWAAVADHNDRVADAVDDEHGAPHGETARALADFASNHYAKPIERLTEGELAEFEAEYFPRNAWPSDDQRRHVESSVELTVEVAESTEGP